MPPFHQNQASLMLGVSCIITSAERENRISHSAVPAPITRRTSCRVSAPSASRNVPISTHVVIQYSPSPNRAGCSAARKQEKNVPCHV